MELRFKCPSCLRKCLRADVQREGVTIADRTCPKCGVRNRFKIEALPASPGMKMHVVTNTAKLN
jgi:transcription elongation factor Elf1